MTRIARFHPHGFFPREFVDVFIQTRGGGFQLGIAVIRIVFKRKRRFNVQRHAPEVLVGNIAAVLLHSFEHGCHFGACVVFLHPSVHVKIGRQGEHLSCVRRIGVGQLAVAHFGGEHGIAAVRREGKRQGMVDFGSLQFRQAKLHQLGGAAGNGGRA